MTTFTPPSAQVGRSSPLNMVTARKSLGVPVEISDTLQRKLFEFIRENETRYLEDIFQPAIIRVCPSEHPDTMSVVGSFLAIGDKAPIAELLGIAKEDVNKDRLVDSYIFIHVKTYPRSLLPEPSSFALTFIALGELSRSNGLPAFGASASLQYFELKSGEALHVDTQEQQHFPGNGGGLGVAMVWKK